MSQGGGPHGQSLGFLKCTNKTVLENQQVSVAFKGDGRSTAVFILSDEDAEYYTVGENYHFSSTQP